MMPLTKTCVPPRLFTTETSTRALIGRALHNAALMVASAPIDAFYETSSRNVAVLLLFWLSYIVSYLVLARSITLAPSSTTGGYVGKRRSNLSRLMLLGRPKSRPRSVPPLLFENVPGAYRTLSLSEASDISTFTEDGSRSPIVVEEPADMTVLGKHLLSSFSLEYTVAVFSFSMVLQTIFLLPVCVWGMKVLAAEPVPPNLQWLSILLLRQWMRWIWACTLGTLLAGIPISFFLRESKEHRDALGFKKISILAQRFLASLARWRLIKPLYLLLPLTLVYFVATIVGITHPFKSSEWLLILNIGCVCLVAPVSLFSVPLGIRSVFRGVRERFVPGRHREELQERIHALEEQIEELNASLHTGDFSNLEGLRKRRLSGSETTPVSSKSLRSKRIELEFKVQGLRERAQCQRKPFGSNLKAALYLVLCTGCFLYILFTEIYALVAFISKHLLWYMPGIQLIDRLFLNIAGILHLAADRSPVPTSNGGAFMQVWVKFATLVWTLTYWQYLGLKRIASRKVESVAPVIPLHNTGSFHFPKRSLDRVLRVMAIALVSTVLFAPLLMVTGATDMADNFLSPHFVSAEGYYSPLVSLLPKSLTRLLDALEKPRVLRFPLLFWLILIYRLLFVSLLALIGTQSMRSTWRYGKSCIIQSKRTVVGSCPHPS